MDKCGFAVGDRYFVPWQNWMQVNSVWIYKWTEDKVADFHISKQLSSSVVTL